MAYPEAMGLDERTRAAIASASRGDAQAVDGLLTALLPGLRAFVRLRAGPLVLGRESGDDLVQSTCREILENLHRFQHSGEDGFRRWLYRTALRKIADRHAYLLAQRRDVVREHPLGETAAAAPRRGPTPSQEAIAREQVDRIEGALERLPADYREVIVLARQVGLSHAEIAAEMQRSQSAIRTLLSRALARLAQELEQGG